MSVRNTVSSLVALVVFATGAYAVTVSGVVREIDGTPIPYASVQVIAADNTSVTAVVYADSTGAFRINTLPPARLITKAVGYIPDTTEVSTPSDIVVIRLQPDLFQLPDITVSEYRPTDTQRTTAFVSTILPDARTRPALTVPDVLDEVVGVRIRDTGGHGSFSTVSIRGSSSEQVRVYLDGIPLNQALGGGVNLAAIPLSVIESVDVYRGVIPPRFGGSGTAGVVSFTTRSPSDTLRWRFRTGYGSWNTKVASAWLTRSVGPVGALVAVDYSYSDNDFRYLDDNGTTYNPDDDEWVSRTNNQFRSTNVFARIASRSPQKIRWDASYGLLLVRNHLPGNSTLHAQESSANLQTEQHLLDASVGTQLPWLSEVDLQGYRSFRRDRYDDRFGQVGLGRQLTDDSTSTWGGRLTFATYRVTNTRLAIDASAQQERFSPNERLITDPTVRSRALIPSTRRQYTGHISTETNFFDRSVELTTQLGIHRVSSRTTHRESDVGYDVRLDTTSGSYVPRSIGMSWRIYPWLQTRANWGRYVRIPNLFELFGDRGGTIGNDKLQPESGTNRDIGIRITGDVEHIGAEEGVLEVVYFDNQVKDAIVFWEVYNRVRPFNMGATHVYGVELHGGAKFSESLSLSGNVVMQRPKNTSTAIDSLYYGSDLPHQPRWQLELRPEYNRGRIGVFSVVHGRGRYYRQPLNRLADRIDAKWVFDMGVRVKIGQYLAFTAETRNITDVKEFHSRYVPLPGRSWFLTLQGSSL